MSEGHKDPVRPWLPPALPRKAPRAAARRGACPRGELRAGWIFTGVTALATGAAYGLALARGPGVAVFLTAAEYLAPFALLVALVTAILAMVRGAVWGGIFLLVLSPVVIVGARFAGAWAGDSWRGWRHSAFRPAFPLCAPQERCHRQPQHAPAAIQAGYYAINIHWGGSAGTSSWGCQTAPPAQWEEFRKLSYRLAKNQPWLPYILIDRNASGLDV